MNASSHLEIEIKLPLASIQSLIDAGFEVIERTPRHFEDNWLFDFPDSKLKGDGSALRVRQTPHRSLLTFKGRPLAGEHFKVREEIELEIGDASAMVRILTKLGLQKRFRYQKHRTVYEVRRGHVELMAMHDETPIGEFLELEGPREAIVSAASALGFSPGQFITQSYVAMQAERCAAEGRPLCDLVFDVPQDTALPEEET